jgi:putative phosphonate metabolism protein
MKRYAIYFAPDEATALHTLGSEWLGRDARTAEVTAPTLPESIPVESWTRCTEAARRYGFHATLKPPFKLVEGASAARLTEALTQFAARQRAFHLPKLCLGTLGRFLALVLSGPCRELHQLAADCVREMDEFRAPADPEDVARRMSPSLHAAEQQNLIRWGYPYVLDTWKFHMTLTSSLGPDDLAVYREHLAERFDSVCREPVLCDSICLFEESAPNAALLLTDRFPLAK